MACLTVATGSRAIASNLHPQTTTRPPASPLHPPRGATHARIRTTRPLRSLRPRLQHTLTWTHATQRDSDWIPIAELPGVKMMAYVKAGSRLHYPTCRGVFVHQSVPYSTANSQAAGSLVLLSPRPAVSNHLTTTGTRSLAFI